MHAKSLFNLYYAMCTGPLLQRHAGDCFHVEDRWIIEDISDSTSDDDNTAAVVQRCRATCKWRISWTKSPYFVKMIIEVLYHHTMSMHNSICYRD
jgi:VAD1 Analog of StAR-related lipid transfer domain